MNNIKSDMDITVVRLVTAPVARKRVIWFIVQTVGTGHSLFESFVHPGWLVKDFQVSGQSWLTGSQLTSAGNIVVNLTYLLVKAGFHYNIVIICTT